MTSKQHQPGEKSLEHKAVRTESKGHGQKSVGPASLSLLRFRFSIFWTRNTTRHLCSHASGHEVSREPLTWTFLGSMLLKPEKSRAWRTEHFLPLPSWCPQSKPRSHGPGDRHQGKCWEVMDGWRDQELTTVLKENTPCAERTGRDALVVFPGPHEEDSGWQAPWGERQRAPGPPSDSRTTAS